MTVSTNPNARILAGECYCRTIGYAVVDAFEYALNCHCSNCRRTTGSAFKPFAGIARDKLRITRGDDSLMVYGDATGHNAHCRHCGSLSTRWSATAPTSMWRWVRCWTIPRSAQRRTLSRARRRPGIRSPTTCRNMRGISWRAERPFALGNKRWYGGSITRSGNPTKKAAAGEPIAASPD